MVFKMDHKNYYRTLGIPSNASPVQVRKAFQDAARQTHPDKTGSNSTAHMFREAHEAFNVLISPEERKRYDNEWGQNREEQNVTFSDSSKDAFKPRSADERPRSDPSKLFKWRFQL